MAKQQKNQIDNLYNFSNNKYSKIQEKEEKKKIKERQKRIKQRKDEQKNQFDIDTETVIGMTNKNNQKKKEETQKRITKKQANILRKKKKIKRIVKFITLILLIAGGMTFALVSPIFNIKEIQVINNKQIATETIISLSQLQEGQNIFRFNRNKVEKEIKTNPYVEIAEIKRKFPNKIEISIKERQKNYNVEFVAGNRLNTHDLGKIEVVIQIMNICRNYELEKKVSSIDITDKNNYIIYMEEERKTIYIGDGNNLNNKMLYVPAVIKENEGKEGNIYIDNIIDTVNKFQARFREKV